MLISTRALSKSNARDLRQRRHDKLGCGDTWSSIILFNPAVCTPRTGVNPRGCPVDQSPEPSVTPEPSVLAGLDYWRELPLKQQPPPLRPGGGRAASDELATLPPLVFAGEVDMLRERLAAASAGRAFLLQGGDCAETFA